MSSTILAASVLGIAVTAAVIWAIDASNRFKTLLVKIAEADSGIDVALTKRYDTQPHSQGILRGGGTQTGRCNDYVVR